MSVKNKNATASVGTGAMLTSAIVWVWGVWHPEVPIPAEVASAMAGLFSGAFMYLEKYLP